MKIRVKLLLFLFPPLLLSGLLINHLTGRAVCSTLHGETSARVTSGARRLLESAAPDFAAPREEKLLPFLYSMAADLNASGACFAGADGTILAHTDVAKKGKKLPAVYAEHYLNGGYAIPEHGLDGFMEVYVPVTERRAESPEELALRGAGQEKKQLGILVLDIPLKGAVATENRTAKKNTLVLAGVYSGILLAAFLLTGLALRPIPRLMAGTERIRLGDYDAHISVSSHDEFGDLARSFNEMAKTLSGTIVSKNYLDAIVDNMVETLVVTDMGGVIRRTNTAARAIIGRPDKDLTNTGVMDLFPWEGREPGGWLALLRKNGEVRDFETVLAAGPGVTVPVLVSASFIQDNEGNNSGIVAVIRDITLRKKYETEMLRSNEDLQRFAFVASHDLQEPLKTITNYIQLLEAKYRTALGPESEKHVEFITGAVSRMRALILGLLQYSKINASLHLEAVDSGEALDYVIKALENSISASKTVVERGNLPTLRIDRCHLESLLQNLISNAIKYRNGAAPQIRVSAEKGESGWIFEVRDNGAGIESAYEKKLFKLFGRLHGKDVEGAGIGLASCKKIVEYYGGKIWFKSEPGKGSSFFFSIPGQPG